MAASDTGDEKFNLLKDIYASVVFLTRLPAPGWPDAAARKLANCMWAFPIAGVVAATVAGIVYAVCNLAGLPVYVSALLCVTSLIVVTGGLHEDGIADFADGVWGGATAEKRLAIMSDSSIGAYGTIALIVSVSARAAAIATIDRPLFVIGALVAAAAVSRAIMPAVMVFVKPAKPDGLGASAGTPDVTSWVGALLLAFIIALFAAPAGWIACLAAAAIGAAIIAWFAKRTLGGYTGDVLGAAQQTAEILALAVIASAISGAG